VNTHIQGYLPFQLQTVGSVFDLVWLSKTNSNVVEYLVDAFIFFFFFYISRLVHTIWRTRLLFPLF
jgi:hypothetical protein